MWFTILVTDVITSQVGNAEGKGKTDHCITHEDCDPGVGALTRGLRSNPPTKPEDRNERAKRSEHSA